MGCIAADGYVTDVMVTIGEDLADWVAVKETVADAAWSLSGGVISQTANAFGGTRGDVDTEQGVFLLHLHSVCV